MKEYDHNKIEKKWQKEWETKKVYKTQNTTKNKKHYVLDMFPYPSGAGLHVGHPRGYIGSDVYARMKRMQGYNVLHPMGYDAFGLPAEQYAIEHKIHPRKAVEKNIKTFRGQLDKIGFSYDWSREVNTTDPEYYKWTQWIFLQIYNSYYDEQKNKARPISELIKKLEKENKDWKKLSENEKEKILMNYRLAYEGYSEVNWCPKLGTVLANDEIVDDKDGNPVSERGGYPVEKKSMRQWFMRITSYADRLVSDLEDLNWSSHIKEIQKNWIGVSEGSEIEFKTSINRNIKVFTTRADTLFGVTYVVLSPEHTNIGEFAVQSQNMAEVTEYIRMAKERAKKEDITVEKEKTGVELKGIKAINPANGEEVPVWVADYVLASYGTGAVMAVPAHDERDFEFAKKYNLPIKEVIAEISGDKKPDARSRNRVSVVIENSGKILCEELNDEDTKFAGKYILIGGGIEKGEDPYQALMRELSEEIGTTDVKVKSKIGTFRTNWFCERKSNHNGFWTMVNHGFAVSVDISKIKENTEEAKLIWIDVKEAVRNFKEVGNICQAKILERYMQNKNLFYSEEGELVSSNKFTGLTSEQARKEITKFVNGKMVTKYKMRDAIFARQRYWGEPIPLIHKEAPVKVFFLISSLEKGFDKKLSKIAVESSKHENWGINYFVAVDKLNEFIKISQKLLKKGPWYFDVSGNRKIICFKDKIFDLSIKGENEKAINYGRKINIPEAQLDWKVEEIKKEEIINFLSEKDLPLVLPSVTSYEPTGTGESPLAGVKAWAKAGYETNTMPGWAGSSWYFLRYMDPKNKKAFADKKMLKYWKEVDMYVGGSEHATGHLLYSRFWHKFLFDMGYVPTVEPFKTLKNQGMILASDGRKMSKRWGNVINPDDIVKTYGADTLRVYEMFMGPFEASQPWNTDSIIGSRRFIERVWKVAERIISQKNNFLGPRVAKLNQTLENNSSATLTKTLHKTVKKVHEDISNFAFNTAISSMMVLVNEMDKVENISVKDFKIFLQILAPFAPHITEELWREFGEKKSIHLAPWPKYNPKFLIEDTFKIVVQINGKVRAEMDIPADANEESVFAQAFENENVKKWIPNMSDIKKKIYIKGRLINFVI